MPSLTVVLVATDVLTDELATALARRVEQGARVVAWEHKPLVQDRFPSPRVAESLQGRRLKFQTLAELLDPDKPERADWSLDESVIAWFKSRGRISLDGKRGFRDIHRYGSMTLWWWAELYLYHETPLRNLVRDVYALRRLVDVVRPTRLVLVRPSDALVRAAESSPLQVEVIGGLAAGRVSSLKTSRLFISDLLKMLGTGLKSLIRRRSTPIPDSQVDSLRVFFLSHASMWRRRADPETGESMRVEMYFDRVIPAIDSIGEAVVVAFGPPVPFKARSVSQRFAERLEVTSVEPSVPGAQDVRAIREYFRLSLCWPLLRAFYGCLRSWRRFARMPGVSEWLSVENTFVGNQARLCVRDTFLRQFPWAIRVYHEVQQVVIQEKPQVMVLYAESSGLGRAAILAARDAGIRSVALQHGIMYPQYFSHEHEPDELEGDDAVPIPDVTAVFGRAAKRLLVERSGYDPERVVVSGSPKFDALIDSAKRLDRRSLRTELSISDDCLALVLASRHSALGAALTELIRAVESDDRLELLIKPHPAESVAPYEELLEAIEPTRTRLLHGSANLLELIVATDALVTVDSFASSEALVVGRPVLVVNLPGNLSELVDRGCAVGVVLGESVKEGLDRLLFDDHSKDTLEGARREYLEDFAGGADGRSTQRIVETIRRAADKG